MERFMTIEEVAEFLSVHPNTVRRWTKKGLIKSYRLGPKKDQRFTEKDVWAILGRGNVEEEKANDQPLDWPLRSPS